jgi:MFS transporter, SP family, xylose:H+ symportor
MAIGSLFVSGSTGLSGVVAICLYLTGLGMSFGPIVWILMSEIFPAAIRGQAMSVAIAAQWAANFLVSASFPLMFDDSWFAMTNGGFAFFVYGAFGLLAAFLVLRHVPETKGLDQDLLGAFWRRHSREVAA